MFESTGVLEEARAEAATAQPSEFGSGRSGSGRQARAVAVIGAGAAGLAAASQLARAGHEVTVYESRAAAGGRLRTEELDGIRFDAGAQLVSGNYRQSFALTRFLGVGDRLVRAPGRDAVWRQGRLHSLRYGSVASMITSGALPTSLKLRLATTYLPFLSRHGRLDLHDLVHTGGPDLDIESVAEWGGRELGADFVELLAYPLLGAYYGCAPEETSAALYHGLARVGMDVTLFAARAGFGELATALAEALAARRVSFRFQTPIDRVETLHGGVALQHAAGTDRYDAVVVATPAPDACRVLPTGPVTAWLEQVRCTPTCTLGLVLERPVPAEYFGVSLPRSAEFHDVVAICIQERKGAPLVPHGRGALVVIPAPDRAPHFAQLAPAEVLDLLLPVVERVLPGTRDAVIRARVTTFSPGNPLFYPGYVRHLQALRPDLLPTGVALAGDYLVAPTMEGAVRSGLAGAQALERWFNSQ